MGSYYMVYPKFNLTDEESGVIRIPLYHNNYHLLSGMF